MSPPYNQKIKLAIKCTIYIYDVLGKCSFQFQNCPLSNLIFPKDLNFFGTMVLARTGNRHLRVSYDTEKLKTDFF
jgi:hypothetical protein